MAREDRSIPAAFARVRAGDKRLATWMTRNHDAVLRELGSGRVEWAPALAVFAGLGLTDEHGRTLTRDTASRTWRRVRTAVAAARQVEARDAARPGELVRGVRLVAPPVPRVDRPTHPPLAPTAPAAVALPGSVDEATEHIRDVLAVMGANRVPLPRQTTRTAPTDARSARDRTPET